MVFCAFTNKGLFFYICTMPKLHSRNTEEQILMQNDFFPKFLFLILGIVFSIQNISAQNDRKDSASNVATAAVLDSLQVDSIQSISQDSTQMRADSLEALEKFVNNFDVLREVGFLLWRNRDLAKKVYNAYPNLFVIKGYYPSYAVRFHGLSATAFEVGIVKGKRDLFKPLTFSNWHASAAYLLVPDSRAIKEPTDYTFGLNVGYGKAKGLYCYSIDAQAITSFYGNVNYSIRPEVGVSILGTWNLTYGYSIFLNDNYLNLPKSTITLRFTPQSFRKNLIKKRDHVLQTLIVDYPRFVKLGLDLKKLRK